MRTLGKKLRCGVPRNNHDRAVAEAPNLPSDGVSREARCPKSRSSLSCGFESRQTHQKELDEQQPPNHRFHGYGPVS